MRTSTAGSNRQRGFTYALVMASVVVVGIAASGAHQLTSRMVQADREAELLFRGVAIRDAIAAYHRDHQRFPRSLEDLVRDPSSASRRYLRQAYADPMAEEGIGNSPVKMSSWKTFETADGGISGVASKSKRQPLKKANFPPDLEKFSEAESYADWAFQFQPLRPGALGLTTDRAAIQ
jgi:type II secretory pathway pseudopilin PulG